MLKFTRNSTLLTLLFLTFSMLSFGQYSIEQRDNKHVFLKKGKVQKKTAVTKLDYFEDSHDKIEGYLVHTMKKDAIAYRPEGSETWRVEWFDKVILPKGGLEPFCLAVNGLVHIVKDGKHGLYSCGLSDYLISPNYDAISLFSEELGYLKIQKGKEYALLIGLRFYEENSIEDQLIFADKIRPEYECFVYTKNGQSNVYTVVDNVPGSEGKYRIVKQLDEDLDAVYEWPIAKRNGKFGLVRTSIEQQIPNEHRFYNNEFDTLYFLQDPDLREDETRQKHFLIGVKDGKYHYLLESIKDFEGFHYSSFEFFNGSRYRDNLSEEKQMEIYSNIDLMYGYWQVNKQSYDNIYFKEKTICVQRGELYGVLTLPALNSPQKQMDESMCKSKSSNPEDMIYTDGIKEITDDKVTSFELFASDGYGGRVYVLDYADHSKFLVSAEADNFEYLGTFKSISELPNHNFVLNNDGALSFINHNQTYKNEYSYKDLVKQLENNFALVRPMPPNSYFQGYEVLNLHVKNKAIQVMMDSRGIEYVVTKAFLSKYSDKYDVMEFLPTQTKLSEYLKK